MRALIAFPSVRLFLAFLTLATALLAPASVRAMLPEGGWYWNPNESGRGYNLEIQDNILFIAAFAYRADGSQAWYAGSGTMSSDRQVTGELFETVGGQCFGCAFRGATGISRGFVSVSFTSERSATISLLGTTVNVVRQDWSGVGAYSRDALYGEWSTTDGDPSFPIYSGERITLNAPVSSGGIAYASGYRTGSTSNIILASYDSALGSYYLLIDSSSSYYRFYVFTANAFNHYEGLTWIYLKTQSISGNGTFIVAHRTKSGTRVRGSNGPGVSKTSAFSADRDAADAQHFAQQQAKAALGVAPDAAILERYRVLATQLEEQLNAAP